MGGITFYNIKDAKEYQSSKRKQGIVINIQKIIGGYRAILVGDAQEWKNDSNVTSLDNILNDEK
jgi:hypothetical protein